MNVGNTKEINIYQNSSYYYSHYFSYCTIGNPINPRRRESQIAYIKYNMTAVEDYNYMYDST